MTMQGVDKAIEQRVATHRTGDFEIVVRDAEGVPVPRAQVACRLDRHDFRLGANGFLIRGGSGHKPDLTNASILLPSYERTFAELLNYATLPFYWGSYEPVPGEEKAETLRRMATWCQDHGLRVKGHPLAWHEVFPKWADELPDTTTLQCLFARVSRLVADFSGLVNTWDVFNETTVAATFDNAVGRWVKVRGAVACVAEMLHLAREANPDAELLYNDFNVSPAFEALVEALLAAGAPMDAIGIQSHMHKGAWADEKLWETCETYARFGVPLHFTEATLLSGRLKGPDDHDWHRRQTDWPSTPDGEQRQLEEGSRFYSLLFSHPAVDAITWWDFSDRLAWQGAPSGLIRNDMSTKPLADWLRKAFGEHWTTRVTVATDDNGRARFHGFFGDYTVQAITQNGCSLAGGCTLSRRGLRSCDVMVD